MKHCTSCAKDDSDALNIYCTECGLSLVEVGTEAETLRTGYELEPLGGFPSLEITVQPQGGERRTVKAGEWVGSRGQRRGIEGLSVEFNPRRDDLSLRYMGHFQVSGDTEWVTEGTFLQALPSDENPQEPRLLEGFAIELTGDKALEFSICYYAHIQGWGDDVREHTKGELCGSRGLKLRVEAIMVKLFPNLVVKVE